MKKTRFSEEQMVAILRDADAKPVPEVAKKHGVATATIYAWRKHFGGLEATDVKRLVDGLDKLTEQFSDTKTVVLTMETEIETSELEKYGTLISQEDGIVVLEVKRSETAEVVSAVLQNLPVADVKIDELSMEEIIRRLFQRTNES